MLGFDPGWWWKFCWLLCAPIFLMVIIVYGLYSYEPLTYGSYVYPTWANVLGLIIAGSSVACIPVGAVIQFIRAPGKSFRSKMIHVLTPIPPVFIPTTDVNELLAAAASAGISTNTTGLEQVVEHKKSSKYPQPSPSHPPPPPHGTSDNSDNSCNSDSPPNAGGRCGGRIGVNCLHKTGGSSGNLNSDCSNCNSKSNSEQSLKCNLNIESQTGKCEKQSHGSKLHKIAIGHFNTSNQQQQQQQPHNTVVVNPSISLDSTQV